MHPKTRIRDKHYQKRVRKQIEEKYQDSDLWKRLNTRFGNVFGNTDTTRPILDDEHE